MTLNNRSLIITILIILAILLMALIGLLMYNILTWSRPDESSATIYLVDSSIRMAEPLGEGSTSRLQAAQQFVSQSAVRLSNTEIVSVHVFGSGASDIGCEDTVRLVQLNQGNQTEIVDKISELSPISSDAAMVRAAIEALEELGETGFTGRVQLIIITGGDGTCNDDLEQILRAANSYGFELETVIVPVTSNREAIAVNIPAILNAKEIVIDSEEAIAEVVNLVSTRTTEIAVNSSPTPTQTPVPETPTPPILEVGTVTVTQGPGATASAIPTTVQSPTVPATATEEPAGSPTIPVLNPTETPDGSATATETLAPTATGTNTPIVSITPTSTLEPTATRLVPTNTFTPIPPEPTSPSPTNPPPPPPPDSTIFISDIIVNESAGNVFVIVSRGNVNNKSVLVNYDTSDGTALAGLDYTASSGQVTWQANDGGDKTIIIPIINDQLLEPNETFNVNLSNSVNASISDNLAIVTIQDNESGDILINPFEITVGENAGSTSAGITLNGQPQGPVSINLTSTNTDLCIPVNSVTLDANNWASGVPVNITIVDNPDINQNGFSTCIVQTSASTSSDGNFNNINPVDIEITIIDNEATYVDHTCLDRDGNTICDDGIRFRTIQSAIDNGTPVGGSALNIIVMTGPHNESGINVNRDINLSGPAGIIVRAADSVDSATNRIMTINSGFNVTINDMTLENGNPGDGNGGAILNEGSLTLNNVTIQNSRTNGGNSGGAVASTGALVISDSTLVSNQSAACGGAVYISPSSSSATISSTNFTSNQSALDGGAICADEELTLSGGTLAGNIASGNGGAIFVNSADETLVQNANLTNNRGQSGGAIFVTNAGDLRTVGSTYSLNQASAGTGGAISSVGNLNAFQITVSANQSSSGGSGIHNDNANGGIANIFSSTIAFNISSAGGALVGDMVLVNTLLENPGGDCAGGSTLNTFYTLFSAAPAACTVIDNNNTLPATNPPPALAGLGPLTNNGGSTLTHLPLSPGPVIDAGPPIGNQNCPAGGFDQRGAVRPQGTHCDIGSVEQ